MIISQAIDLFGTAGWTRTTDLLIHSQAAGENAKRMIEIRFSAPDTT
jgi:hypothetical protein